MSSDGAPDDITMGEIWRGMADLRADLATIGTEMRNLPAALAKELDERTASRVKELDERTVARVEAHRREVELRLAPLEIRVGRLERILWAVIAFVFAAVATALLALVVHPL